MAHLVGLNAALSARRKFVDEAGEVSIAVAEGTGTGSGGGGGGGNLFQGGMHKSTTGFVGLVNQGATCYLNSLLQTLYMLPEFRRALLLWRYDASRHGEEDRCLSRQLQRLFAHLQLSKRAAVTTGGLTKSFGWTSADAFVQQDVTECLTALMSFLESQSIGDHISAHHRGEMRDVIACSGCGDRRARVDSFQDLHLEVTEGPLTALLAGHGSVEELDDVECGACGGRHTHAKGIELAALPDVLTVHLKRFALDYATWQRVKLNHKVSIPQVLNMAPYVKPETGEPLEGNDHGDLEYELMSMMMHVGGAYSGHYFAIVRDPFASASATTTTAAASSKESPTAPAPSRWLKFNDNVVEPVSDADLEELLAGDSSAYMLVYRRCKRFSAEAGAGACGEDVLDDALVPADLAAEVAAENLRFDELKAQWLEQQKWINVTVYGPNTLAPTPAPAPAEGGGGSSGGGASIVAKSVKIHKDSTVGALAAAAADAFKNDAWLVAVAEGRARLRQYDRLKNVAKAPLGFTKPTPPPEASAAEEAPAPVPLEASADTGGGGGDGFASVVLGSLPDSALRGPFVLEVAAKGEALEPFLADGVRLRVLRILPSSSSPASSPSEDCGGFGGLGSLGGVKFAPAVEVVVSGEKGTVGDLRSAAQRASPPAARALRLVWFNGVDSAMEFTDDAQPLKAAVPGLNEGDAVYVEEAAEGGTEGGTRLVAYFERLVHSVKIFFNDPTAPDPSTAAAGASTAGLPAPPTGALALKGAVAESAEDAAHTAPGAAALALSAAAREARGAIAASGPESLASVLESAKAAREASTALVVEVDRRGSLADLKARIADALLVRQADQQAEKKQQAQGGAVAGDGGAAGSGAPQPQPPQPLAPGFAFRVRRSAGGQEFKDLTAPLSAYGLEDGSSVDVRLGPPMAPGEFAFNVKFVPLPPLPQHTAPSAPAPPSKGGAAGDKKTEEPAATAEQAVVSLGPVPLVVGLPVPEVKALLFARFGASHGMPPPRRMRLRKGAGTGVPGQIKLGGVVADDVTLEESFTAATLGGGRSGREGGGVGGVGGGGGGKGGLVSQRAELSDGKVLVVQALPDEASAGEQFTSRHMLLRVRRWRPSLQDLGVEEEVGVLRDATYADLAQRLAAKLAPLDADNSSSSNCSSNSSSDDGGGDAGASSGETPLLFGVAVAKPFAYLLKDVTNLAAVRWAGQPRPEARIDAPPLRLRDGDLIVFKRASEPEDPELVKAAAAAAASSGGSGGARAAEPLFKIFSPGEQVAREAAAAVAEAAATTEADERAALIQSQLTAQAQGQGQGP